MPEDVVFKQLKLGPMENFSYVFGTRASGQAAVVDPGFEPEALLEAAAQENLTITTILLTHTHRDHIAALGPLRQETGATVIAHPDANVDQEESVEDRQRFGAAGLPVEAVYTPGHCPDHVAYIVAETYLLSGDALFIGECGRVDLPGSDVDAMYTTLQETIPSLDPRLEVYPGHDYGPEPHRSLAVELEENYTLEKRDREAFKRFMAAP